MPFIEDCYNTKKHAITGFSPYELLFGVKPNKFIDYTTEENRDEVEALAERTTQLKKPVDSTRESKRPSLIIMKDLRMWTRGILNRQMIQN